jgi:hypothetical protein
VAAFVLTVSSSFVFAAVAWLTLGSRISFSADQQLNDIANMVVYFGAVLPVSFVVVFFGLGASS